MLYNCGGQEVREENSREAGLSSKGRIHEIFLKKPSKQQQIYIYIKSYNFLCSLSPKELKQKTNGHLPRML